MICPITTAPIEVQNAFTHVKSFFPNITSVSYDEDCHWTFSGTNGYSPDFSDHLIDQDILEAGADAQYNVGVPVKYTS